MFKILAIICALLPLSMQNCDCGLDPKKIVCIGCKLAFSSVEQIGDAAVEIVEMENLGIKLIPEMLFRRATSLKKLNLKNNEIVKITGNMFDGLVKLENINLAQNSITYVPFYAFKFMENLQDLDLSMNPVLDVDFPTEKFPIHVMNTLYIHDWPCDTIKTLVVPYFKEHDLGFNTAITPNKVEVSIKVDPYQKGGTTPLQNPAVGARCDPARRENWFQRCEDGLRCLVLHDPELLSHHRTDRLVTQHLAFNHLIHHTNRFFDIVENIAAHDKNHLLQLSTAKYYKIKRLLDHLSTSVKVVQDVLEEPSKA